MKLYFRLRKTTVFHSLLAMGTLAALSLLPREAAADSCPSSSPLECSAGWCCPYGDEGRTDVCCNSNPQSQGCTKNGNCSTNTNTNTNTTVTCTGTAIPTQDTCGESTCSCASPCSSNSDCQTGCCRGGYCALACTCSQGTAVQYNCSGDTETTSDSDSDGCSVAANRPSRHYLLGLIPVVALLARRARRHKR